MSPELPFSTRFVYKYCSDYYPGDRLIKRINKNRARNLIGRLVGARGRHKFGDVEVQGRRKRERRRPAALAGYCPSEASAAGRGPPAGVPPRLRLPWPQLRRERKAAAPPPRCGSSGAAAARPASPGHPTAAGGGARPPGCAAGPGSLPFPLSRHVPCGRGAAPAGPRTGGAGGVWWLSAGRRRWSPRALHSRRRVGSPAARSLTPCRAPRQRRALPRCGVKAWCGALVSLLPTWRSGYLAQA